MLGAGAVGLALGLALAGVALAATVVWALPGSWKAAGTFTWKRLVTVLREVSVPEDSRTTGPMTRPRVVVQLGHPATAPLKTRRVEW